MFYLFNVIKVQFVTIVSISGLCGNTQKSWKKWRLFSVTAFTNPIQERDMLQQSVCCRHIHPSASEWWCPWARDGTGSAVL